MNGSEDEEELIRMQPSQADDYFNTQARLLEALRQEIDNLEITAGNLGDFIDHGHPTPCEEQAAFSELQDHHKDANQLRRQLQTQVEALRHTCPKILTTWAAAHRRVCLFFLSSLPPLGIDAQTALFVAKSTLEAWEQLPYHGETFISISTVWMEDYMKQLDREFDLPNL